MIKSWLFNTLVYLSILFLALSLEAKSSAKELLNRAKNHFDKGHYSQALSSINSVEVTKDLDSSEEMELALRIRAISFGRTKQTAKARVAIRELFFLNPNYEFDAFATPKDIVDIYLLWTHYPA